MTVVQGTCKVRKAPLTACARVCSCVREVSRQMSLRAERLGTAIGHSRESGRHRVGLGWLQSHQPRLKNVTFISRETRSQVKGSEWGNDKTFPSERPLRL